LKEFEDGFEWSFNAGVFIFLVPVLIFLLGMALFLCTTFVIGNFLVPIMYKKRVSSLSALKECVVVILQNKKNSFLYVILMIGLQIAAMILAALLGVFCLIGLGAIGALVFGLPYLIFMIVLKWKIIFIGYAIVLGIPFVSVVVLMFLSINLPFAVFFRTFSLHVLAAFKGGYDLFIPRNPCAKSESIP